MSLNDIAVNELLAKVEFEEGEILSKTFQAPTETFKGATHSMMWKLKTGERVIIEVVVYPDHSTTMRLREAVEQKD